MLHLLIVEDEPDGQQVLTRLLRLANVSADAAGTAEEGLDLLNRSSYDAVIIDLALPGMDGFGLLKKIRQSVDTQSLPCVAVTAYHSSEVKKQVLDAGFNGYFAKPINARNFTQDLLQLISRA